MSIIKKISCMFGLVLLFGQTSVSAEEVKMYSDKVPSAEEMSKILFPKHSASTPAAKSGVKMRSISFGKAKKVEPVQTATVNQQQGSMIGLPIKFAYNSAEVLSDSKPFLNEIGRMLTLAENAGEKLIIEGHTDAAGAEDYNRYLSEKRALSVKQYLSKGFNISSDRLFVVGMGESQSLPGVDPYAAVNRRVQFRRVQ